MSKKFIVQIQPQEAVQVLSKEEVTSLISIIDKLLENDVKLELLFEPVESTNLIDS